MTRVIGAPRSRRRRWTFIWCCRLLASDRAVRRPVPRRQFRVAGPSSSSTPARTSATVAPKAAVTDNATTAGTPGRLGSLSVTKTATLRSDRPVCLGRTDHAIARSFDSETAAAGTRQPGDDLHRRRLEGSAAARQLGRGRTTPAVCPTRTTCLHAMAARYAAAHRPRTSSSAPTASTTAATAQIGFWFFKTTFARSPTAPSATRSTRPGTVRDGRSHCRCCASQHDHHRRHPRPERLHERWHPADDPGVRVGRLGRERRRAEPSRRHRHRRP